MTAPYAPSARIGHVHLKVADLDRAIAFYGDVLGFEVQTRLGTEAAFLGADGYHHHIGLNTWRSKDGIPAPEGHTGLFHTAILYPSRADLATAVKRVLAAGYPVLGASDHGVSEAVYFNDPDGNGVELYRDRDPAEWPRHSDGSLQMYSRPLSVQNLLSEHP
ncbi:VOC family protein [Shimia marina]|uniref:Catechol-2,3-dioxygenase n=1 Tax=Shimia marina TaxID=321267 RepID=A0A0P1EUG4_9RHOB|nr:VOC family protein [Shimia marina]CUH54320.1 Catechol-2,3-dioxygenase [Shimia marina]SFE00437.1 catechol 2,3-dioxygenase [Shimia marina]